jgi:hypothetical protein
VQVVCARFAYALPAMQRQIFLLSPARLGGKRAQILLRDEAKFDLATRVRSDGGAPVGEIFAFLSGLYFRGKLTYAAAFARAPASSCRTRRCRG